MFTQSRGFVDVIWQTKIFLILKMHVKLKYLHFCKFSAIYEITLFYVNAKYKTIRQTIPHTR
jgi:hypothetical protein